MPENSHILILDPSKPQAEQLAQALEPLCPNITAVYDPHQALELIHRELFDLIITEIELDSDIDGTDILTQALEHNPNSSVIITDSTGSIESCKRAIRSGAFDYLVKPLDIDHLKVMVKRTLPRKPRKNTVAGDFIFQGVISHSRPMQSAFHVLRRVSPTDISVLIEGESGTGKELMAKAIHENSLRKDQPYIPINCAGLTESLLESELFGHVKGAFTGAAADRKGLIQLADKGTLFLDEIGDMPQPMQAKLLRVLEDGTLTPVGSGKAVRVDVRVISATNQDLAKLVEQKKFRQDLYFRIKGVSIVLPPLRSRPDDIEELFGYFLQLTCRETGRNITRVTEPAMSILRSYSWPGNIRQLRHTVRMMVIMCDSDTIDLNDIPPDIHNVKRLAAPVNIEPPSGQKQSMADFTGRSLEQVEREHIKNTLDLTDGNRSEAAKILKIGERTLYRKIKEYDL